MTLVRPDVMPHTYLEIAQVLGLDKIIADNPDLIQKVNTAISWLEDNRRWLEDQNGTSVSRINTLGRTYTTAQVNEYLFGDGATGSSNPVGTSGRLKYSPRWTSYTISAGFEPSGFRMQASGTLTIASGVTIAAPGNGQGGAVDIATGRWKGGDGANIVAGVHTEAEDVLYWGGGDGGIAAEGTAFQNRGGSVNGGALLGNTLDSFDSLLSVPVGGGAGGGAYYVAGGETYHGGGGGGVVCILANTISLASPYTQSINANGAPGDGGAGNRSAAGGGGGVVFLIARTFLPDKATVLSRCFVNGGAGDNGGADGQPGRVIVLTVDELGLP